MRVYVTHDIVLSVIIRHFFPLFLGYLIHKTRLLLLTSGKFCLSKQSLRKSWGEENLVLFTKHNLDREMRLRCWTMRRLQNGLYHPQRKKHRWWLLKFYMVRNIDCYLHRQRHKLPFSPLQTTVRTLLVLSYSLGTLRSQRKFSRIKNSTLFEDVIA